MGTILSKKESQINPKIITKIIEGFQNVSEIIKQKEQLNQPITINDYIISFDKILSLEEKQQAILLFQKYLSNVPKENVNVDINLSKPPTILNTGNPADVGINLITALARTTYQEDFPTSDQITSDLNIVDIDEKIKFKKIYETVYKNLKKKNVPRKHIVFQIWASLGILGPWFRGGMVVIMFILLSKIYGYIMWKIRGVRFTVSKFFSNLSDSIRPPKYYRKLRLLPEYVRLKDPRYFSRGSGKKRKKSSQIIKNVFNLINPYNKKTGRKNRIVSTTPVKIKTEIKSENKNENTYQNLSLSDNDDVVQSDLVSFMENNPSGNTNVDDEYDEYDEYDGDD